ncbi:hypothetical protein F4810DRAFT_691277 [Camillea tinctor]|nr:hypothetical protein F4810DRAFT_691277 [Camillea tinctor]
MLYLGYGFCVVLPCLLLTLPSPCLSTCPLYSAKEADIIVKFGGTPSEFSSHVCKEMYMCVCVHMSYREIWQSYTHKISEPMA